jgi:hypothetical protein
MKSSTLLREASRRWREAESPPPNMRSKTSLGFTSLGSGWVGERHDIVLEYTHE